MLNSRLRASFALIVLKLLYGYEKLRYLAVTKLEKETFEDGRSKSRLDLVWEGSLDLKS